MTEKTFYSKRPITIKIDDEFIAFHFKAENDREFYWIPREDCRKDEAFWIGHMEKKMWFTKDMTDFIREVISSTKAA